MANITYNTPDVTITEQGIEIPEVQAVRTGVLQDMNDAFGGNLNIENVATPQGFLSSESTYYMALKNAQLAFLSAMFDPSTSQGRWLDALAQIYFIQRKAATATVVTCQCVGVPGYTLPAGSLARDADGNIYACLGDAVFSANGSVDVQFQCQTLGAIDCPVGAVSYIQRAVTGWDSVTNTVAGVIGSEQESDRAFEQRRYDSVAQNAQGSISALRGAVASIEGVTDVFCTENNTSEAVTYGATNYSLLPHSVYVGVVGGADADIAEAIWRRKNAGSNMNGNTTVSVSDTDSYVYPYPTYNITFNRPTSTPLYVEVNLQDDANLPAEIVQQTKQAVLSVFSGEAGNGRGRIGGTIYTAGYYGAVMALSEYLNVISIYIGKSANPTGTMVTMGIDEAPVLSESQITVNLV